MKQIKIIVETLSPVVLSVASNATILTASNDYFTGTILRGIISSKYIGEKKNIHLDSEFRKLFFDELRFVSAYPIDKVTKKRSINLPASLQKNKSDNKIIDLLKDKPETNYKSLKGLGVIDEDGIIPVEPLKNIRLHMSRTNIKPNENYKTDKGNKDDKNERLAGQSLRGGVYNYEALECDQAFEGYIFGSEEALGKLKNEIESSWECNIGRSRYTQYGLCRITLGKISDIDDIDVQANSDGMVYLRLETPMLHWNNIISNADMVIQQVADYMNNARNVQDEFYIIKASCEDDKYKVFTKIEEQDNFVGIWNMRRPRSIALSAGSIFALCKNSEWMPDDYEALKKMLYDGVGIRTEEGFGQLRIWNTEKLLIKDSECKFNRNIEINNNEVKRVAVKILNMHLSQMVRIWAADDARSIKGSIPPNSAHLMSKLDAVAVNKTVESVNSFRMRMIEMTKGSDTRPIRKTLSNIRLKGDTLLDLLCEEDISSMPYINRMNEYINRTELINLYNQVGISDPSTDYEIFREYWHWFFRHCRKVVNI